MTFAKGDRVQFFGSVPLPEGGFPYRGDAYVLDVGENNEVILDRAIESAESGDYVCKAPEPLAGLWH